MGAVPSSAECVRSGSARQGPDGIEQRGLRDYTAEPGTPSRIDLRRDARRGDIQHALEAVDVERGSGTAGECRTRLDLSVGPRRPLSESCSWRRSSWRSCASRSRIPFSSRPATSPLISPAECRGWSLGRTADQRERDSQTCIGPAPLPNAAAAAFPYSRRAPVLGTRRNGQRGQCDSALRRFLPAEPVARRIGILPFFVLAAGVIWAWARRLFGDRTALTCRYFCFCALPPILGHAGLATTDMAITAGLSAAVFAFEVWLGRPTLRQSAFLGVALAIAVLSKFSALLFLPVCLVRCWPLMGSAAPGPARSSPRPRTATWVRGLSRWRPHSW